MGDKTKIFISSAYEDSLKDMRLKLYNDLNNLGHEAMIFEENFGPWGKDNIKHCLEKVEESDIFILIIGQKVGSKDPKTGLSITHLEYKRALHTGKPILVFAETAVKKIFFDNGMLKQLSEKITSNEEVRGLPVDDKFVIESAEQIHKEIGSIIYQGSGFEYDPYTWFFLWDVAKDNQVYEISTGIDKINEIKNYLSHFLKKSVAYLSDEELFNSSVYTANEYIETQNFIFETLDLMKNGKIQDWYTFLASLQDKLKEGVILKDAGTYAQETICKFSNCKAITLYKYDEQEDVMVLVEGTGIYDKKRTKFNLDDNNSYVAQTYNCSGNDYTYFYNEDKQTLYFTYKISQAFVLCCHYKLSEKLSEDIVNGFEDEILDGIMNSQGGNLHVFTSRLLGGIY
ncbi:DUF4062 domain-containing protein [Scopulibacillus cellulosilyticus]|uniref:DUF4062 domain-containing protein n=1 Tax=Scopulibacillus cellulosilyticus TaxID=2665665 RepID=A0ABW2Q2J0_9BACL